MSRWQVRDRPAEIQILPVLGSTQGRGQSPSSGCLTGPESQYDRFRKRSPSNAGSLRLVVAGNGDKCSRAFGPLALVQVPLESAQRLHFALRRSLRLAPLPLLWPRQSPRRAFGG